MGTTALGTGVGVGRWHHMIYGVRSRNSQGCLVAGSTLVAPLLVGRATAPRRARRVRGGVVERAAICGAS